MRSRAPTPNRPRKARRSRGDRSRIRPDPRRPFTDASHDHAESKPTKEGDPRDETRIDRRPIPGQNHGTPHPDNPATPLVPTTVTDECSRGQRCPNLAASTPRLGTPPHRAVGQLRTRRRADRLVNVLAGGTVTRCARMRTERLDLRSLRAVPHLPLRRVRLP